MEKKIIYFRDLLRVLIVRELKSKYTSTVLGFFWIFLNSLLQMIILTMVFSFFLKIPIANYPIFVFTGLLPWMFFSASLLSGTSSIVNSRDIIKKVAFPRQLLPVSSVLAHLIIFLLIYIPFTFIAVIITNTIPNPLFLIAVILIQSALMIGITLLLSSLEVYYRDVSYILQALLMVWFYLTPIFYSLSQIPEKYIFWLAFNPMVGIVHSYQSIILSREQINFNYLGISLIEAVIIIILGTYSFKKRSVYFADKL